MRTSINKIRKLGFAWPPNEHVAAACKPAFGAVNLEALLAGFEASLANHQREQDEMYAFATKWNAPVDEITDRRGEAASAIQAYRSAIATVRAICAALASPDDLSLRPKPPPP